MSGTGGRHEWRPYDVFSTRDGEPSSGIAVGARFIAPQRLHRLSAKPRSRAMVVLQQPAAPPVSIASRRSPGPGLDSSGSGTTSSASPSPLGEAPVQGRGQPTRRARVEVSIASRRSPGPGGDRHPGRMVPEVSIASRRSPGPGRAASDPALLGLESQSPLGEAPVPGMPAHYNVPTHGSQSPFGEAPVPGLIDDSFSQREMVSIASRRSPGPGSSIAAHAIAALVSQSPLGEAPVPGFS